MILKKIVIFLFLIFSIIPIHNIFAQIPNVGFIPSNIWYSKDPFIEGDKIKVYTLVYNPDNRELSCTVIFFDNTTLLGTKNISISPKSVKDVSIDWTVIVGDHTIFAKIENAKFLNSVGKYEEVYLAENKTNESKKSISKKVIANVPDDIVNKIVDVVPVSNIKEIIKNNTPPFVAKTIDYTVNSLENIRVNADTSLEIKKEAVKKEIDSIEKSNAPNTSNSVEKPLKYVKLFFLNTCSFIFKNKIVFYSLLAIVIFLIIRYLWRLIF